jgi:hypothetical protein
MENALVAQQHRPRRVDKSDKHDGARMALLHRFGSSRNPGNVRPDDESNHEDRHQERYCNAQLTREIGTITGLDEA